MIIFFDTETTGIGQKDRLCQLAIKERGIADQLLNTLYKPPLPIALQAMAVHHITEEMVSDRPQFMEAPEFGPVKDLFEHEDTIAIAHNAAFDISMLAREGITPRQTICTYKVARALDPEGALAEYKLQYLRYLFGLRIEASAHDAWGDVLVLEAVFEALLTKMIEEHGSEEAALSEMLEISNRPMLFTTLRFGKYKGKKIEEVVHDDSRYLDWLLDQKKMDPEGERDWIYSLEHHLGYPHTV